MKKIEKQKRREKGKEILKIYVTAAGLTPREMEILNELRDGKTYKEIAGLLFRSTETIRTHVHRIYVKLGVKNRIQAINKFYKTKFITLVAWGGNLLGFIDGLFAL